MVLPSLPLLIQSVSHANKLPIILILCSFSLILSSFYLLITKTVVLKDAGATKIAVIKVIRDITGLGLVEAKALADNGGNIKENVPAEEANDIKAKLEEAGATIELA